MTKRIFHAMFTVALMVLLCALMLVMCAVHSYFTGVQRDQLRMEMALAAQAVNHEGSRYFENLDGTTDCRITWIAADGSVLYDNRSDSGEMENHLAREEVRQALAEGYGEATRYSGTLMARYIYAAQRLSDGTVLRLSTSHGSVLSLMLGMSGSIALAVAATLALSLWLSRRLSRQVVRPLNELNLDEPLSNTVYDEIQPLLRRLDSQQRQLRAQSAELKHKQREFNTVTRSLSEGLVLMNSAGTILSINPAAAGLLEVTPNCLGAAFSVANRNREIEALVEKALTGQKGEQTVSLNQGQYLAAASPVLAEEDVYGVVLLLFDVTQKHQAEQLRREFTANVSHELKTPLHAISGYAELMKSGMVPPEDMTRFSEKIYTEVQRLIRLVEDILRLSRLDEGAEEMGWAACSLYDAARQTIRELAAPAELKGISLKLEGDDAVFYGIPQLVSAILFNLTDNAVKYNRPGGSVTVRVENRETEAVLTVTDTGIGIPQEHQERVFERFYRVDKSHSKEVGGTGLGLSIVKHAVLILGAKLNLESKVGRGTTVTVRFPKE